MASDCTALERVERRSLSPKLGQHAQPAAYATAALNACLFPNAAREKGPN